MSIANECLQNTGLMFQSIATCAASALTIYHESISSAAVSPVKTSATPDSAPESQARALDYGANTPESFANYDPDTCSWRTSQLSFIVELTRYSASWPRSGMMRNGTAYPLPPLVRHTDAIEYSLWPTPVAHDDGKTPTAHMAMKARMPGGARKTITSLNVMVKAIERGEFRHLWPTPTVPNGGRSPKKGGMSLTGMTPDGKKRQIDLAHFVRLSDGVSGQLNPQWVEWLMGFPEDWTDLGD